jgi:Raf kinase inhibitor-like YbhB/YbcL family protein
MRIQTISAAFASGWLAIGALLAQPQQTPVGSGSSNRLARDVVGKAAALTVTSPMFMNGGAIPEKYSDYGGKMSPPLAWTGQPQAAKSFAIIVDDPDAKAPAPSPFVHWVLFNLPPAMNTVPESVPTDATLTKLGDARQGKTSRGSVGYFGPRPPAGDPPHHYHFQVFAVDTVLDTPAGADRDAVLAALKGHVLAHGEVVGTFQAPGK